MEAPSVPDFGRFLPGLNLGRRINVAVPCTGINGCWHALQMLGVPHNDLNTHSASRSRRRHPRTPSPT
eukprot:9497090-Pyramimonas_sp.AAC.1